MPHDTSNGLRVEYTAKCQISCLARVNAKTHKNQLSYGATPHASCRHERFNFILFAMRCCITLPALPHAVLVPEMHRGRWGATGAQAKEWTGAKTTAANLLLLVYTRRCKLLILNIHIQPTAAMPLTGARRGPPSGGQDEEFESEKRKQGT